MVQETDYTLEYPYFNEAISLQLDEIRSVGRM